MKNTNSKILVIVVGLIALTLPTLSFAAGESGGVNISPYLMYYQTADKTGSSDSTTSGTLIDLKAGYLLSSGLYLGAAYTTNAYAQTSGNTTTTLNLTAYGLSIGYFYNGFYGIFNYDLSSEYQISNSTKYTSGTGTDFDLGYRFIVGTNVAIGPSVSVKTLTYTKVSTNGTEVALTNNYVHGEVYPYVTLWFMF
jgi:hypothetical protein